MDLFNNKQSSHQPLAARMRPQTLDEYAGQNHIIGEGRLLRRVIQADQITSIIFYGPPGTGKTTLARVIANTTKSSFVTMNAVLSGVKDLREAIQKAKDLRDLYSKRTILFVDEVHRWNKAQQDALLPWVENGTIILIGATTENPYFEVNKALVSRSRIFQLIPLETKDLMLVAKNAIDNKTYGYGNYNIEFEKGALEHIINISNGDARTLLNALELAVETTPKTFPPESNSKIYISLETAEESIQKKVILYDKEGDYHFDTISAFIKSIRGSDPDAALFWMAKMIKAGEDPRFIFRRMLISASEDIGMADPNALVIVEAAARAFDRIGLPEGQFHLTHAALYLSTAPKSNSALGFFDALKTVEELNKSDVPNHLRDSARDSKGFGHGEGYKYPHAFRDHWVAQQYLPDSIKGNVFYNPGNQGFEGNLKNEIGDRKQIQIETSLQAPSEILTFTPENNTKQKWINRTLNENSSHMNEIRESIFSDLNLSRHSRVLDISPGFGLLVWEALRQAPEGGVWALVKKNEKEVIEHKINQLESYEKPILFNGDIFKFITSKNKDLVFEAIVGRNIITKNFDYAKFVKSIVKLLTDNGKFNAFNILPSKGQRISEFLNNKIDSKLYKELINTEDEIYNNDQFGFNLNTGILQTEIKNIGLKDFSFANIDYPYKRLVNKNEIDKWFNSENDSFGAKLTKSIGLENTKIIKEKITTILVNKKVNWKRTYVNVKFSK